MLPLSWDLSTAAVVISFFALLALCVEPATVATEPSIYRQPQRYTPVSDDTPSSTRLRHLCREGPLGPEDLALFWLASAWKGFEGRDDLPRLRVNGVRALQLSPCVVRLSEYQDFLDRVWTEGLTVVVELPDHLFLLEHGGCLTPVGDEVGGDCYDTVRRLSRKLLASALTRDGMYHPAVEMVMLARDMDAIAGDALGFTALLSAWDGLLDAEHEMGIHPGTVGIAALLSGAETSSREPASCHHLRAPAACLRQHTLRAFWSQANMTPGWARPTAGQGLVRRGLQYVMEPSGRRGAVNGTYVAHNDLGATMASRWVHTFEATSSVEEVVDTLRSLYEFISPALPPRRESSVLLDVLRRLPA